MKAMTKKLLLLIASLLLVSLVLSACGLDSVEVNDVSEAARQKFIDELLAEEDVEILYAPLILDEEGDLVYDGKPSGYHKVGKSEGAFTGLTDMYRVLQNKSYELYMDFKTTDIAVVDLKTGYVYHSNPARDPQINGNDLGGAQQKAFASPLSVTAYDSSGKLYSFNFYENAYSDGTFYVTKKGDGTIRLIYTIGNDPDKDLFPPVITESTYQNVILKGLNDKLEDGTITQSQYDTHMAALKRNYRFVSPNPQDKSQELSAEDKERFASTFPTIEVMNLYISVANAPTKQRARIKALMETIGFTAQDVKKELEKADYQGAERSVMYTIPVDLSLNEEGLCVEMDSSLILGPTKQRLYTIDVYRRLGATKNLLPNGYMIVPDGSGAVIPVKGGLTSQMYKGRVYGADGSFLREYDTDYSEQILAPYVILDRGVVSEDDVGHNGGGIIAVMEEGAGVASVVARPIQSATNPVASVNYEIVYSERDYRTYSTSAAMMDSSQQTGSGLLLSKDAVTGTYRVQYLFTKGGMTYSEYASYLRGYFMRKDLFPKEALKETELPLFVDLIGCVDMNDTVLGIPVKSETPLTTYNQALEILSKLKDAGVSNVVARYSYWANGGENNFKAKDLKLLNCMGTKGELDALVQYCNDNEMGFFPSVDFLHITSTGNGFSKTKDAARGLDRATSTIVERNNANGSLRSDLARKILISSDISAKMAETYKASFENAIQTKSIALGELGKELYSNYKANNNITRLWAEKDHVKILQTFEGYDIAVSTGNFYTWNYASHIFNLPTGSSEYHYTAGSIPFTQIMLHGFVNYSMEPLNKTGDYETALLLALETGSAFSFRWMGAEDSVFDYTEFYNYFSLNYGLTFERAIEIYKEAAAVLNDVVNEPITDHVELNAYYVTESDATEEDKVENSTDNSTDDSTDASTDDSTDASTDVSTDNSTDAATDEDTNESVDGSEAEDSESTEEAKPVKPATRKACGGVFATKYGNKKVIVVNYNAHDVELANGTVVPAKSYLDLTLSEYNEVIKKSVSNVQPEEDFDGEENFDDANQEG